MGAGNALGTITIKFGSRTCSDTATKEQSLLGGADGDPLPTFN